MKVIMKKMCNTTYKTKKPPVIVRLCIMLLFTSSVVTGLLKRWELFGLCLGVLLMIVIGVCYMLLSTTIDERFDKLEELVKSKREDPKEENKQ